MKMLQNSSSKIYESVKVQPLASHKFKLLEAFNYKGIVVVPKGYETNGADVPRVFWSFLPPNRSDYLPAVILHDYLCDLEKYTRADEIFEDCLKSLGVSKATRIIMVLGVKLYHKLRYKV